MFNVIDANMIQNHTHIMKYAPKVLENCLSDKKLKGTKNIYSNWLVVLNMASIFQPHGMTNLTFVFFNWLQSTDHADMHLSDPFRTSPTGFDGCKDKAVRAIESIWPAVDVQCRSTLLAILCNFALKSKRKIENCQVNVGDRC